MEQLPQFPHLQQLLGLSAPGAVELAHIMEPPVIQTATSILPLGWTGVPGDRNAQPLKVDIVGHGLHLCKLVQAQGAGKTSLFRALLSQGRQRNNANFDIIHADVGSPEVVAGGIRYLDSAGVNLQHVIFVLQELHLEVSRFREELQIGARELSRKTDLVVLVHNLSNKIPWFNDTSTSVPALSLLLNEAKAHEIPWVLAITNKFSVSAHQQKMLIDSAMEAYKASPDMTVIVNSCPFVIPTASSNLQPLHSVDDNLVGNESNRIVRRLPFNIARLSFQKKVAVMPVEGITAFRQLVHRVLASNEEMAFQLRFRWEEVVVPTKENERETTDRYSDDRERRANLTCSSLVFFPTPLAVTTDKDAVFHTAFLMETHLVRTKM
ncbi:hypothetical protein B296_00013479 [Ensete ventricosum]|uniref:Uncharacterized protein n=1 Tax=Ensete ventricosum TaxID=4639 RepID=A0A427AKD9_ENSVE|nr:hypothetical protein B296_00013479 [Ensete ventricosum]